MTERLRKAIQPAKSQLVTKAEAGLANPNDSIDQAIKKKAATLPAADIDRYIKVAPPFWRLSGRHHACRPQTSPTDEFETELYPPIGTAAVSSTFASRKNFAASSGGVGLI